MSAVETQVSENIETASNEAIEPTSGSLLSQVTESPEPTKAPLSETPVDNSQVTSWRDKLSEELKTNKTLSRFKDESDLAKSYLDARGVLSKRVKDMTRDDAAVYRQHLDIPQSAASYEFKLPAGVARDEDFEGAFKEDAFNQGLTQDQAANLYNRWIERDVEAAKELQTQTNAARANAVNALKAEFGDAFEARLSVAQQAARHFGGDALIKALDSSGLGDNPEVIKAFAKAGLLIAEDRGIDTRRSQGFGTSPGEAAAKIEANYGDSEFMKKYNDPRHPGHQGAIDEMTELFTLKNPGSKKL